MKLEKWKYEKIKNVLGAYLNVWGDLKRNWLRNLGFYYKTLIRKVNGAWLWLDLGKLMDLACVSSLCCELGEEKGEKVAFWSM